MIKLIVNRGIVALFVLLGALFSVFSINYFLPTDIVRQLLATVVLTVASLLIAVIVGTTLSWVHRKTIINYIVCLVGLFGIFKSIFWSRILLILIFAISLGWFPAMGSGGWRTVTHKERNYEIYCW